MAETLLQGLLLLAVVGIVSGLARRTGLLRPILLLLVGIGLSFVAGPFDVRLDPEFVLHILLPLLIYCAARESSLPELKTHIRPVMWLAFGHVVFVTVLVGLVVHAAVPSIPLSVGFALGAVLSPPDAVSATAIARRIGLPRRAVTILEGESLLNDATALVLLRVAVAAGTGELVTWFEVGAELVVASVGGALIGLAAGMVGAWLHRSTDEPLLDNTISILLPFLAFLPAEYFGTSGVVAVVVCAVYVGHRRPRLTSAASRLQMDSFWRVMQFLLEGVVFLLVGLQLRAVVDGLASPLRSILLVTLLALGLVIVGRFVWVLIGFGLRAVPRLGEESSGRTMAVVGWAGMRGVITLAAALGLPQDFPERHLIVWVAFVVIVVTLLGQGLTLAPFVSWVGLPGDDRRRDLLAEAETRQTAYRAATNRLDELVPDDDEEYADVAERLRMLAERRAHHAWERLGDPSKDPPSEIFRRLRREMLNAEREVFVRARDEGRLPDDVLRRVQQELDLEEMMLVRGRDEADEAREGGG